MVCTKQAIKYKAAELKTILSCLLYTSDAADERSSVDLGGRRIIKKKTRVNTWTYRANKIKKKKTIL